ncbi:unnamed protein product [Paramecium octaurelia]|uniref:Uncharacterized protein n=1 Tax=Paramecium octaurelia TaxID=43137 RepID=A0A8S1U8T7_PAROT|nr:unnamed protein product [Paramecium octaurelia]
MQFMQFYELRGQKEKQLMIQFFFLILNKQTRKQRKLRQQIDKVWELKRFQIRSKVPFNKYHMYSGAFQIDAKFQYFSSILLQKLIQHQLQNLYQ